MKIVLCVIESFLSSKGNRDGTEVRGLAAHQCGPGSISGLGVVCTLSLLLALVLAPRVFSLDTTGFHLS